MHAAYCYCRILCYVSFLLSYFTFPSLLSTGDFITYVQNGLDLSYDIFFRNLT